MNVKKQITLALSYCVNIVINSLILLSLFSCSEEKRSFSKVEWVNFHTIHDIQVVDSSIVLIGDQQITLSEDQLITQSFQTSTFGYSMDAEEQSNLAIPLGQVQDEFPDFYSIGSFNQKEFVYQEQSFLIYYLSESSFIITDWRGVHFTTDNGQTFKTTVLDLGAETIKIQKHGENVSFLLNNNSIYFLDPTIGELVLFFEGDTTNRYDEFTDFYAEHGDTIISTKRAFIYKKKDGEWSKQRIGFEFGDFQILA